MRNLDLFVSRFAGVPFSRHDNDCLRFVCRWLQHNGLPEMRDRYDMSYRHRRDFAPCLKRSGLFSVAQGFDDLGYNRTDKPRRGDFMQLIADEDKMAFGIFDGEYALTISQEEGLCAASPEFIHAWRLPA